MLAGHDFGAAGRDAQRVMTPSMDSDDEFPHIVNLEISEKSYRLFSFRKDGRSWINAVCTESSLSESDIKARAKRFQKTKHGVSHQLEKMSVPRRNAVIDLLERVKQRDSDDDWEIVAIENDKPELTKRTGEVVGFSVILARSGSVQTSAKPVSRERRRSSFISPTQEFAMPARRNTKPFAQSPPRDKINRQSQSFRNSQHILEDDPFGSAALFSPQGKPLDTKGNAPYTSTGLPPHIPIGEPIGAKLPKQQQQHQQQQKGKLDKKTKKANDEFDLDALIGPTVGAFDLLGGSPHDDHHGQHFSDSDSAVDIGALAHDQKHRGRKRNDSGFESKTPKRAENKSKSKPRQPSLHIPKDSKQYTTNPIEIFPHESSKYSHDKYSSRQPEVISAGRRRPQSYHGSKHGSEAQFSVHSLSDQSVLEAEYEDYSSSGSSAGARFEHHGDWRGGAGGYAQADGRYQRTREHRRGPASPQHARYESELKGYGNPTSGSARTRSRPRSERFISDGAIQPYHAPYVTSSGRPTVLQQHSTPRFEPRSGGYADILSPSSNLYNHDTGLVPYPSDLRRRDTVQGHDAELYIQSAVHQDREIELLQRERDMARSERDLARRESELHQEAARRASISAAAASVVSAGGRSTGGRGMPKYTHEPRLSRRYTDAYYA